MDLFSIMVKDYARKEILSIQEVTCYNGFTIPRLLCWNFLLQVTEISIVLNKKGIYYKDTEMSQGIEWAPRKTWVQELEIYQELRQYLVSICHLCLSLCICFITLSLCLSSSSVLQLASQLTCYRASLFRERQV